MSKSSLNHIRAKSSAIMNKRGLILFFIFMCTSEVISKVHKNAPENTCTNNNKCIMKCCSAKKHVDSKITVIENYEVTELICASNKKTIEPKPTKAGTMDDHFKDVFMRKPNLTTFEIKSGVFKNVTFRSSTIDATAEELGFNIYLNEHAELSLETPNAYDRWIRVPNDMYCLDKILSEENGTEVLKPGIWVLYQSSEEKASRPNTKVMNAGMVISCFFLLLVLVVYSMLPELRKLNGMILMAYVISLFCAYLTLIVMRLGRIEKTGCKVLTCLIYYFFMASFCWMNVMSYDIWWTFRGYAKTRPIHRRGEKFKFIMYCLYAFGLPLAMTIMLAVLDHVDLQHMPWFVTPKLASTNCFIEGGEQLLYMYIPMLILILCNWVFFLMTAFNIWRLSRGTAVLDKAAAGTPHAHRTNRKRFMIYLKLSIVMGLSWLLEVISYSSADSVAWLISDYYNIFIGVAIFLIFVCKRKIFNKLRKRFTGGKNSKWYPNQEESSKVASSTCESTTANQETQAQAVPLVFYNNVNSTNIVLNNQKNV